jgi:hypothetical protein
MRKQLKLLLTSIFLIIIYTLILIYPESSLHYVRVFCLFISGIILLGLYLSILGKKSGRWLFFLPISLVHSYFLFFSTADGLMRNIMGRPFSFIDAVYLNDLYHLLVDSYGFVPSVFLITLIISVPILLFIINYVFFRELGKLWVFSRQRRHVLIISTGTALILILLSIGTSDQIWLPGIIEAKNMLTLSSRKREISGNLENETNRRTETITVESEESYPLDKLNKTNVFIFIVESYGRTLFENPDNWIIAEPSFDKFENDLKSNGYTMASSSLESPALGGNSWLADSTLNSGIWVKDQTVYDELIQSKLPVLGNYFKKAGYRTIIAQPGMRESGDEEYFYNFDKTYNFIDFEYKGPSFVWAKMSDQYVVDFIDRKEVKNSQQALFAQYVLISSHFPFQIVPVYIDNWNSLGDGSVYNNDNMVTTLPIPEGKKTAGPYGLTISLLYVMEVLTKYLINQLESPGLVIILGDHQPYSKVTGPFGGKQVAIHVLSKNPALIQPFLNRNYTEGLISPSIESAVKMDKFLSFFLKDFSSNSVFQICNE